MIAKTKKFFGEVKGELYKATWPWDPKEKGFKKFRELFDSTVVVVIAMLILGGYISFSDYILVNIIGFLTK